MYKVWDNDKTFWSVMLLMKTLLVQRKLNVYESYTWGDHTKSGLFSEVKQLLLSLKASQINGCSPSCKVILKLQSKRNLEITTTVCTNFSVCVQVFCYPCILCARLTTVQDPGRCWWENRCNWRGNLKERTIPVANSSGRDFTDSTDFALSLAFFSGLTAVAVWLPVARGRIAFPEQSQWRFYLWGHFDIILGGGIVTFDF